MARACSAGLANPEKKACTHGEQGGKVGSDRPGPERSPPGGGLTLERAATLAPVTVAAEAMASSAAAMASTSRDLRGRSGGRRRDFLVSQHFQCVS